MGPRDPLPAAPASQPPQTELPQGRAKSRALSGTGVARLARRDPPPKQLVQLCAHGEDALPVLSSGFIVVGSAAYMSRLLQLAQGRDLPAALPFQQVQGREGVCVRRRGADQASRRRSPRRCTAPCGAGVGRQAPSDEADTSAEETRRSAARASSEVRPAAAWRGGGGPKTWGQNKNTVKHGRQARHMDAGHHLAQGRRGRRHRGRGWCRSQPPPGAASRIQN